DEVDRCAGCEVEVVEGKVDRRKPIFKTGAAINFILVTDEDRDVTSGLGLTVQSIQNSLTSANILLNAVVNNSFSSDNSQVALGIDSDGTAYVADGGGGFSEDTGGTAGGGFGTTTTDYVNLAIATGGAAWDLNQLRAGGDPATSFASAFIDIKVQEIISQPPSGPNPIPLPAGMPLLLAGLGVFGFMRRRSSAA
ncbi:MAG: VPLPA-CTERM sorting domain-containing protein, partial [Pseudomonadota bacterium]